MNKRQLRRTDATGRALAFLSRPEIHDPIIIELREQLRAIDNRLQVCFNEQTEAHLGLGGHGFTIEQRKRELRRDHLLKISRNGRVLLRGLPGINDELRVPHAHAPIEDILEAAKRIAAAVRPHAKAFRQAKFPPGFIKSLERAAAALAARAAAPNDAMTRRSIATRDIRDQVSQSREIIAAIDNSIASYFRDQPDMIATWRTAKRIAGPIGRPRKRKAAGT